MEYDGITAAAQRLAEIIKQKAQTGQSIYIISGEVVSVDDEAGTAMVDVGEGRINALNKTHDKLEAGDSVWLGYIKTLADGFIILKCGKSGFSGVGENCGNGNERFNDYEYNIFDVEPASTYTAAKFNSIKGNNNAIRGNSFANEVSGLGNRASKAACNKLCGNGNVLYYNANNNIVAGSGNLIANGYNTISGSSNFTGLPKAPVSQVKSVYDATYAGTDNEKNGVEFSACDPGIGGNIIGGEYNAVSENCIAAGSRNTAKSYSAVFGESNIANAGSAAMGHRCVATGYSIAAGENCTAGADMTGESLENTPPYYKMQSLGQNKYAAAFGKNVTNNIACSIAAGEGLDNGAATGYPTGSAALFGRYNVLGTGGLLVIGNGTSPANRANALRLDGNGNLSIAGSYSSSGADYAEYFEWLDNNKDNEDRRGRFVTLEGDRIRLTMEADEYILGVVSTNPSIIGDEDMILSKEGKPEYDPVGMLGKLVVEDDGSCKVNGYCKPGNEGIATATYSHKEAYRVISRLDESHIMIIFR